MAEPIENSGDNLGADNDLGVLRAVPIFHELSDADLAGLRELMQVRRFAPGQIIIKEGDPGDDFQVLISGQAQCVVLDAGGSELLLDEYESGSFFGELSMLTGEPRSARIKAETVVMTLALDRDTFFQFLKEHPTAAINALVVLGKRLHRTDSLLRRTVSRNVNEVVEEELTLGARVAETLAGFSGRLSFLVFNLCFGASWIVWNNPRIPGRDFDPYPYGLLSMIYGVEALIFSILVLNTQSRQESKDRIAEEIHHEINTKAEVEIGLILRRLDDLEMSTHHANDEQIRLIRRLIEKEEHALRAPPERIQV